MTEIHGFPDNLFRAKLLQRPQDGALVIVASGFDANVDVVTFVLTSSDGGTTWTPPRR